MNGVKKYMKSARDLGLSKLGLYGLYKIGLFSGHYRRVLPSVRDYFDGVPALSGFDQFPCVSEKQIEQAINEADMVRRGIVRLFGGKESSLDLNAGASSKHWAVLETKPFDGDIKVVWEPGRFGWALTLARAYAFTKDPVYAYDFWDKTLHFLSAHPPNLGRQWQSAQEVAIRLMVLAFSDRVFADAPSSLKENRQRLWQAIAEHAKRIYWTLAYARAQNNNHLLAESAGLFIASLYLPTHRNALNWHQTGWNWLNKGLQNQIDQCGTYMQHSVNYHRVMLQIALFADYFRREAHEIDWPKETITRLADAVRWLWGLTDPQTGKTPNLGANDGAYLFPLTSTPFDDFRPVVEAGARAFLGGGIYQSSNLAEMSDWLNLLANSLLGQTQPQTSDMVRIEGRSNRAFLRTAHFFDRPSHADQLHVDLWWDGENIARDPGTYLYNAPPPWENALAETAVHNTVTIDNQNQMTRGGRFLWLDWAQATTINQDYGNDGQLVSVSAEHDGYKNMGISHQRTLTKTDDGWIITDAVIDVKHAKQQPHRVNLVWQLPDWRWSLDPEGCLHLYGPNFTVEIRIFGVDQLNLIRAGQTILGLMQPSPTWGWYSPTYLEKVPALTLVAAKVSVLPIELKTIWKILR